MLDLRCFDRFALRFIERVEVADNGCWEWRGYRDERYGRFYAGDRKEKWVHRIAWKFAHAEPVPPGLTIDHLCRNTFCVNVAHMEVVTQAENSRRAMAHRELLGHGTEACALRGCRCDPCREAQSSASRRRFRRQQEAFRAGTLEVTHGRTTTYSLGCRCPECSSVALAARERYLRAHGVGPRPVARHGSKQMYTKHKCRCDLCREHWNEYWRARRAGKRAAA